MSFAPPRSRPGSRGSSARPSPRPKSAGGFGDGNLDALPTAHLIELKRSVDGRLAARKTRNDDDDDYEARWDTRSQATVDYNERTTYNPRDRPLSPAISRAGSIGRTSPAFNERPRPSSAGRLRQSVGEPKVVPPRRPITPTYTRRDRPTTAWGGGGAGTVHYGAGNDWDRPASARSRDRTAGIRDDVDIFNNDRKPMTTTNMMRPHSARPSSVTGKIGALTGRNFLAQPLRVTPQPPKAGAFKVRKDLMKGITLLRRFYDRGDLPICVRHCPQENEINWKVEVDKLDFHYYLPIFFDGLRDKEEPYFFFARRAILDMIDKGPHRVVAVLPQLIIFIKNALNTRDPDIVQTTLKILQTMVKADEHIGESLVPYYRQLLPIFNLLKAKNRNSGDSIDYSQRKRNNIGELIHETLEMLEMYGGADAYINIKYMIPTYESCMVV